jgi:hypothetical protein
MIVDKLGQEIKPGCTIVYGHALGRSAGLRIGKVLEVKRYAPGELKTWEDYEQFRITVWGVNDDWKEPELLSKKSTIQYPSRIIVLPDDAVPKEFKELLETI